MEKSSIADLFDAYGRQARLYPSLLTILVALLAVLAWVPNSALTGLGTIVVAVAGSCGLLYALSSFARTRGKAVEKRLLVEWGGWPTTIALRHSGPLDLHTRERYHKFLSSHVAGLEFPTPEEERANPAGSDSVYASAIKWLKEQARGKDFPLVEHENAQYGFRRNLRGLKPYGIALCLVTFIITVGAIHVTHPGIFEAFRAKDVETGLSRLTEVRRAALGSVIISFVGLFAWWLMVTDAWVREAGNQYAEALLAVCDRLAKKLPKDAKDEAV